MSIIWKNGQSPAINATNLNANQQMLEDNADVLNVFEAMIDVVSETTRDYPNSHYMINKNEILPINTALAQKGVTASQIFKNIPQEILSIRGEGEEQLGAIDVEIVRDFEVIETDTVEVESVNVPKWTRVKVNAGTYDGGQATVIEDYITTEHGNKVGKITTLVEWHGNTVWGEVTQQESVTEENLSETADFQQDSVTNITKGTDYVNGYTTSVSNLVEYVTSKHNQEVTSIHTPPASGTNISILPCIKAITTYNSINLAFAVVHGYAVRCVYFNSQGAEVYTETVIAVNADRQLGTYEFSEIKMILTNGTIVGAQVIGGYLEFMEL